MIRKAVVFCLFFLLVELTIYFLLYFIVYLLSGFTLASSGGNASLCLLGLVVYGCALCQFLILILIHFRHLQASVAAITVGSIVAFIVSESFFYHSEMAGS